MHTVTLCSYNKIVLHRSALSSGSVLIQHLPRQAVDVPKYEFSFDSISGIDVYTSSLFKSKWCAERLKLSSVVLVFLILSKT